MKTRILLLSLGLALAMPLPAAQQIINIGTTANDGSGDSLRSGGAKMNNNFTELYTALQSSSGLRSIMGDETGTGALVFAGGALGAATATSLNGLTITTSTGTLTIANGKTATVSNTLTFTGTDGSTVNFGAGGTVFYVGGNLGAATVTSINGLTITSSTGTLTIANGKTAAVNNTLTFSGTDGSTAAFGAGGTVAYVGGALGAVTAKGINGLMIASSTGTLTIANGKTAAVSNTLTFTGTDSSTVAFGAGGTVVYTTASQALTNKTINGANNTITVRLANDVSGVLPITNGGTGATSFPYVEAQMAVNQAISNGNTDVLVFDTEIADGDSCFASSVFTAPRDGTLMVVLQVNGDTINNDCFFEVWKNGTYVQGGRIFQSLGTAQVQVYTFLLRVAASDAVDMRLHNEAGATANIYTFKTAVRYYLMP